jgi:signal transduction histidine kinase
MQDRSGSSQLHADLRRLAAEDPRRAREQFTQLLESGSPQLENLLRRVSSPGEGRLRQMIANAVRARPDKDRVVSFLLRWRDVETDEFAKRAINAALDGIEVSAYEQPQRLTALADPSFVEAYRYAAERLHHQVRNTLLDPSARLVRLRNWAGAIGDEKLRYEILSAVGELRDAFRRLGRVVESSEVDAEHFRPRAIRLADWLAEMNTEYGRSFSPVKLAVEGESGCPLTIPLTIKASDYLLKLIFWNLWVNAHQAVSEECVITTRLRRDGKRVEVVFLDNGDGFPPSLRGVAFQERFSSNGVDRGRGLLEVQEAVERLFGEVGLFEHRPGEYRVKMFFPLEGE